MTWWCITLQEPWTWDVQLYPGIWLSVLAIVVPYLVAQARRGQPNADRARRTAFYLAGALAYWIATDWPLGTLGAGYLASAHMFQFVLYTTVAAPLLLLGIPEWMARRVVSRLRLYRAATVVSRPLVAAVLYNAILLATHSPLAVDNLRSNQFGSFALDAAWLVGGLIMWLPVISPIPELRARSYGGRMVYLFLAAQVVPMIPGGILTFAEFPLYSTYELAPRVGELSSSGDQQLAGVLMKLGGLPVIWGTMFALMVKWARAEGHMDDRERRARARAAAAGSPPADAS
ncbi:MAG TPA: cytochrome c oxidase assembly protein [Acidimicrobiales bacterium]|nr:cytochrome c oxidase assembly protein [Acidimicrobiales bacterium]